MKQFISFLLVVHMSLQSFAHSKIGEDKTGKFFPKNGKNDIFSYKSQIQNSQLSDSLSIYAGTYLLSGQTIKVYIKENTLMAIIPDQPAYELVFVKAYEFNVKGAPGFTVKFETDKKNTITGFTLIQPDGNIKAKKISGEADKISTTPAQLTKEQLEIYAGDYLLSGNTLKIYLSDNILMAKISGQPEFELVPVSEGNFNLKGVSGFSVQFQKDNKGNITECIIRQPGGNTIGKRVKK